MRKALLLFAASLFSITSFCKTVHVFVALCDNANQGIVPVPAKLGNGQEPANNLYWGAMYGVKSYFKRSEKWTLKETILNPSKKILERVIFSNSKGDFLVADAYDGKEIKGCIEDFFKACANQNEQEITSQNEKIGIGGAADLICYVGHDGLMEFDLTSYPTSATKGKDAIILACVSKTYFRTGVKKAQANPVVWTTGLMAPEAYTLHDAIESWLSGKTDSQVRESAAAAYNKYQKCGMTGARNLLVTGW